MASNERTIFLPKSACLTSSSGASAQASSFARREHGRTPALRWEASAPSQRSVAVEEAVPNLFPVVESPRQIFSANSQFQSEEQIAEACGGAGPLPFLLRHSRIFTLSPLTPGCPLARALKLNEMWRQEPFAAWLSSAERSELAIELLNRFLRQHAWRRGLRFDESHNLFFFTRSKPKKLWWENGGKIAAREVTAPHMKYYKIDSNREVEFQCGWKHEAIRAEFVHHEGGLFVRLEPAWFLTELDGKTPATSGTIAPLDRPGAAPEGAEILRTLRFWSAIFAKSHRELRVETGATPIRVRLVPPSSPAPRIIPKTPANLDVLALGELEDDGSIPELVPVEA
jgi:hypothetical protein